MRHAKSLIVLALLLFLGITYGHSQSNPNNAFGDNQKEVEPGVFAIYSGDVNQDGFIGVDDVGLVDEDNLAGIFGVYIATDINGDSFLGVDDVGIVDENNLGGVFAQLP